MPASTQTSTHIILADPQQIARQGLRAGIEQHKQFTIVGETDNGKEALALIDENDCDVLILDFGLRDASGLQVLSELSKTKYKLPNTLVFTGDSSRARIISALAAGARGYMLKSDKLTDIVAAVDDIAQGKTALSQMVQQTLIDYVVTQQSNITNRETEVFRLMARGLSDKDIASELKIAESTVRHHLQNICRKLPFIRSRAEAAAWAWMNELLSTSL